MLHESSHMPSPRHDDIHPHDDDDDDDDDTHIQTILAVQSPLMLVLALVILWLPGLLILNDMYDPGVLPSIEQPRGNNPAGSPPCPT